MNGFGWILLIVGLVWLFSALSMDVSVATGYGSRVNNIGLMASKQNHIIIGAFIILCGLLMIIFGNRKIEDSSGHVKCPFCAELIKSEAIKCKHCGSDLTERSSMQVDSKAKEFTGSDFYFTDFFGVDILKFDAIKDFATQLHQDLPKNTALSVMITYAPMINKLRDSLPQGLRQSFEFELEGMLKAIKGK